MLSEEQLRFLEGLAVAHLATADAEGVPQVVPVCFAVADGSVYIAIDGKPKIPEEGTLPLASHVDTWANQ